MVFASKKITESELNGSRMQIENSLNFLGFVVLENKVKPESKKTIDKLNECEVRSLMATGDNILTAVSVAHQTGII